MQVDRCVCHDITFERLKQLADERGIDAAGLRELTGCGGGCGMCIPYIHVMLRTGQTSLPVMQTGDFRVALRAPTLSISRS
ncbi:MAG: (2Fe-2S)-binding protein [Phycisphaerales bacterium]|nr:(2Fe-2S)-binding protein [Phycisphaerales bacterium]